MRDPGVKLDADGKASLKALRSYMHQLRKAAMTEEQKEETRKYWLTENVPLARSPCRSVEGRMPEPEPEPEPSTFHQSGGVLTDRKRTDMCIY